VSQRSLAVLRAALCHGATVTAAALLLIAVGQPLFTDDAWWHLALGRAFAQSGPWLAEDPLLFAPAGPPSPSSWLFDLALNGVYELAGFIGLRVLHVAAVAVVLGLARSLLRRASGSSLAASAGTVIFAALSTYRLAQLRPDLFTIGLAMAVYRLLLEEPRPPSVRRIGFAAGLFALWANVHAAFPVGLLLLGAGTLTAGAAALRRGDREERARVRGLSAACLCAFAATLCNPLGFRAWAPWFAAGATTPSLGRIVDEWSGVHLFAWPRPTLPPTPVSWWIVWMLLLGAAMCAPAAVAAFRKTPRADRLDPATVGAAAISLALLLGAVRFLWLGVFALLFFARAARPRAMARPAAAWALAVAPALCALAVARWGDWPLVTRGLFRAKEGYAQAFANKYYANPIWIARDAGLEGHLFCDYFQAGFAGFWLAPRVRTLTNGTLNVSAETLRSAAALTRRIGLEPAETFPELLDRSGVDLFLGIRPSETGNPDRPWASTTAHLEDTPGWVPVFRNLTSALYLRNGARHAGNLARTARYYASAFVPFDPERGFDPLRAIHEAPEWAVQRGLVPVGFGALEHAARHRGAAAEPERSRVAAIYAALGLYAEAIELDRATLELRPEAVRPRRRVVWSLLHLRRYAEAEEAAAALVQQPPEDAVSRAIAKAAHELPALEPGAARARLAALPVFERSEVPWLLAGTAGPAARIE
jgi:hypothetical protein